MINLNKQWQRLQVQGEKHLKQQSGVQKLKKMPLRLYAGYIFSHEPLFSFFLFPLMLIVF